MESQPFSLVRGYALRATRLDGCGSVVLGPDSVVETDGFISVALTANNDEGETISVTNAAGKICILDEPQPRFVNYGVVVNYCGVDPELVTLMTGQKKVLNADGSLAVGFRVNSRINVLNLGFALEMWSRVPVAACDLSGLESYGYFLLPFIKGGTLGDFTVENGAINFTMTGAATKDGNNWGVGPYNVVRHTGGVAGPLNLPMDSFDHLNVEVTTVPPPTVDGGSRALGVPATQATAGSPAALVPTNSYAPASFATIAPLTASPLTKWTIGQYVRLRDGSSAYWTGTQWAVGVSPG